MSKLTFYVLSYNIQCLWTFCPIPTLIIISHNSNILEISSITTTWITNVLVTSLEENFLKFSISFIFLRISLLHSPSDHNLFRLHYLYILYLTGKVSGLTQNPKYYTKLFQMSVLIFELYTSCTCTLSNRSFVQQDLYNHQHMKIHQQKLDYTHFSYIS